MGAWIRFAATQPVLLSFGCALLLGALPGVSLASPRDARGGMIAGQVTRDGKAASGIVMRIFGAAQKEARTDKNGRYEFSSLGPGSYTITNDTLGYYILFSNGTAQERALTLEENQEISGVDAKLVVGGVLAGKVVSREGLPETGVRIEIEELGGTRVFHFGDESDDRGEFRIIGLPPGPYLLGLNLRSSVTFGKLVPAYERTFYPGVHDRVQAQVLSLGPSAVIENLLLQIDKPRRGYLIAGVVVDANSQAPVPKAIVQLFTPDGSSGWGPENMTDDNGTFQLVANHQGIWGLRPFKEGEGSDGKLIGNDVKVPIEDDDVTGLVLTLKPAASIQGAIQLSDSVLPLSAIFLYVTVAGDSQTSFSGKVHPDGRFDVSPLPEGQYDLRLRISDNHYYLQEVRHGEVNFMGQPIALQSGQQLKDISVVVASGAATIAGTVEFKTAPPKGSSIWAVALPGDLAARQVRDWRRSGRVDAGGRFTITGVAPGEYQVFLLVIPDGQTVRLDDVIRQGLPSFVQVIVTAGEVKTVSLTYGGY